MKSRTLKRVLRGHIKSIEETAARAALWNSKSRLLPQEMEWLLDNRYLCRREGAETLSALKGVRRLPDGGKPVYCRAKSLVEQTGAELNQEAIGKFLKDIPLTERELWLFVPMLRAALISEAAAVCVEINNILKAFQKTEGDSPFTAEVRAFTARRSGQLPDRGTEAFAEAAEAAHKRNAERMGAVITSLRLLATEDLTETLQNAGVMESLLREDSLYERMDEETRSRYRSQLSRLARRKGMSESAAAERVLELCRNGQTERERHIGTYLWDKPLGEPPSQWQGRLYFAVFALLALIPGAACVYWTERLWAGLLLLLPLSAMAKNIVDAAATRLVPCRPVPRLELAEGLPEEGKTLCVVSALLTSAKKGAEYGSKLEAYRLANRDAGKNLLFGVLVDLPDSSQKHSPQDEDAILASKKAIDGLNKRYGGGFFLFTREREWNGRAKTFMAWERKRGALTELCRLLGGKPCALRVTAGERSALAGTRFIITLDSDTNLTPGSARKMAGAMLHPAVSPVVDCEKRVVTSGHGILAPRMAVELEAAGRSVFSRVFAGQGGLDPYSGTAGEVYHDLFGQGSFHGKGIIHVDAYLQCLDGRFPENRILSHDLLEGNYLRAGLMEDVELSDGFPSTARAWFLRQHRWLRGDWQAAAWCLPSVPSAKGAKREKNPTGCLARWKLFDTLRSSLVPVAALAALTAGTLLPGRAFAVILTVALTASASHLLLSLAERVARPGRGGTRTQAPIITGLPAVVYQTLLMLAFLPHSAVISASAVTTALWRVCVSKKNLLQWVTSAQTEGIRSGAVQTSRDMFAGLAWGVLTACLSRSAVGWLLGAGWAVSPFIAYAVSKTTKQSGGLKDADRAFLLRQSALMWRYFDDFLCAEDNFLIPDNYQEQPAAGIAHRTSPTNIGLSLLCVQAALDLGLTGEERAFFLLDGILTTLESMPKWNGHLLNWYDTRTLEPLPPRCVSSVDSGNLCGYLIALREALAEEETPERKQLAARAGALADAMDFKPLFDCKRKLFVIGVDLDQTTQSGVYDLLASEARQTSYIAVARGEVDKKHWQRLGRAQTALGAYRGMASWTGTMFEYFMPHLLLPAFKSSLLRESLDFAVFAQRAQAARRGGPWGVSESCFYAFDRSLNYQYKAHGVPALAYKRGLGEEWVVAPYASYLSLLTRPAASVENLRVLHAMGLEGHYGLIEAVDFTPARTGDGKFSPVRCYMSHHLGMSLLSVCNALRDNIMQKRFMRDRAMGAFAGLLQERVPVGAAVTRTAGREVPEKPKRAEEAGYVRRIEHICPDSPKTALLGNSSYTVLCTDSGLTRSECGDAAVTRFEPRCRGGAHMRFLFGTLSLLPDGARTEGFTAVFEGMRASWEGKQGQLSSEVAVIVPGNENAELRTVMLKCEKKISDTLICSFEPVLQREADYNAHPAFSKLFIETRIEDGVCLVRRRPRSGKRDLWLALACDRKDVRFETSRERVAGRGNKADITGTDGVSVPIDPCVCASVPLTLAANERVSVCFALAVASTASDAVSAAKRTLRHKTGCALPDETARRLGLTSAERDEAFEWLSRMTFMELHSPPPGDEGLSLGREGLWSLGISGDLPLILSPAGEPWEKTARVIRKHRYLSLCGASCDLAVLTHDGGDYRRPAKTALMETLKACSAEHTVGKKGGVHALDLSSLGLEREWLLRRFASVTAGEMPENIAAPEQPLIEEARGNEYAPLKYCWLEDGSFHFEVRGELPPLGWSHTLANKSFGALVTETGAGYCFRKNARENKMTPWTNDPLTDRGGVSLTLTEGGNSIFAAADGFYCGVTYGFGFARFEKKIGGLTIVTTQFVPNDRMALVTMLETNRPVEVCYKSRLAMGISEERLAIIETLSGSALCAGNPFNKAYAPQVFIAAASSPVTREKGFAFRFMAEGKTVLVTGCARNVPGQELITALSQWDAAAEELRCAREYWSGLVRPVEIKSGSAALDRYANGWALYQVIATRMFARTSLYQCGGAYGFRDQLQDCCAAMYADAALARTQIIRASARQYAEGDVMHWWHPAGKNPGVSDKGVRTRCSDDLLWLPYAVSEYCGHTGDEALLELKIPFLTSPPLEEGEDDRYENPSVSEERGSIYEHCVRALELAAKRGHGGRGLLLMGSGDWNDGMNMVGHKGRGESVWLTWFAAHVARRFAPLCERRGDGARASRFTQLSKQWVAAAAAAWDGRWFLRGTYDDGSTLGSHGDAECRIDSIAQSFSAFFADTVSKERIKLALESAAEQLIDSEAGIIKLFTPAFSGQGAKNPGYIKGYVPGVRENGGQYTHAAVWLALAFAKSGERRRALELLEMLLPETHDNAVYKAEPHVLAADVYSHPEHAGRGGWSHYTGAASWFYRALLETLGL